MKLRDVQRILDAEVICGEDKLDVEVGTAAGCDLVSDLLAFVHENSLLLTGLTNLCTMEEAPRARPSDGCVQGG